MLARQFTILPPLSFISDVRREASTAKKRIYLQAMEVEEGEIADHLLSLLGVAVKNGLDTRLHADNYSLLVTDGVFNYLPLFPRSKQIKRDKRLKKRKEYFSHLQSQGVQVTLTNPPSVVTKIFPMFGRNHCKIAIIDDVAYLGGINYHDANFKSNDCMVKLTDPDIVSEVAKIFLTFENGGLAKDMIIHCSKNSSLIVDRGDIGRSTILNEAVRLINESSVSIEVITPIIPDTRLALALYQAKKRGVKIQVIVPEIKKMKGIYKFLDSFNKLSLMFQLRHIPITFKHYPIHAKILIVDKKSVLLGSHNLTTRGVVMGTEELAIISADSFFLEQANSFIRHLENI